MEEIQSFATYNCDRSNKGYKYPNDIVRGGHPAAQNYKKKKARESKLLICCLHQQQHLKVFHGRISNPKPFFNAACCHYITFQNYAMLDNNLQSLPLFYSKTWRDPQLERTGTWWGGRGREASQKGCRFLLTSSCIPMSWFTNHRRQGKGKVTLGQ